MDNKIIVRTYRSPAGELLLGSLDERLCLCDWNTDARRRAVDPRLRRMLAAELADGHSAVIEMGINQLDEYFAGHRNHFTLPLLLCGTEFQRRVWHELCRIPYGATATYSQLAGRVGRPKAVRAVAAANAANPVSIIVPCHRVIGSDGSLTGYAGGLAAKQLLLTLEHPR